jgi:hypothetical protein
LETTFGGYPTTDKWIEKMWYIYTIEYYSAIQKNEVTLFSGKWMELDTVILTWSKPSSGQRLYVFPHLWKLNLIDKCIHK